MLQWNSRWPSMLTCSSIVYFPNIPVGLCINIPTDWQNAVSSFGPDTGLVVRLYS